ncbi:MAG: hypothetical protein LBN97_04575 [Oscillospiraceae bacterium]|jgi:hypothetical protein|nr:hypothetical protein [Oscillospiraceae bacterium]
MSGYYFLKGAGIGAVAGIAIGLALSTKRNSKISQARRFAGKAVRTFGDIADAIANTITS